MNIFRRIWEWIIAPLWEQSSPKAASRRMLAELNTLADAASFAMACADEKFEQLATAAARHQALEAEAARLLRAGDEAAARECVAQRLEAERAVEALLREYQARQYEADQSVQRFLEQRQAVETKRNRLVSDAEIDSAMYMLRHQIAQQPLAVVDTEGLVENPVASARRILEKPRYKEILPGDER